MKEQFGLYLILTNPIAGYPACAQAAVDGDVRYLQLRMKDQPRETILEMAHKIREITRGTETHFIINDDLSIAMEVDADGIHLGQSDLSLSEARETWNTPGKIYGLSTHNQEQELQAREEKPDYIGIGPIYATPTKKDTAPAIGSITAGKIIQASPLTTVAIGGINTENLPSLLNDGIINYCVVRAVNDSPQPADAIRRLQESWKSATFLP